MYVSAFTTVLSKPSVCLLHSLNFSTLHCFSYTPVLVLYKPLCTAGIRIAQHSVPTSCHAAALRCLESQPSKSHPAHSFLLSVHPGQD